MEYHVIQGRPALKADAMLARFQNAGGKVSWKSYTDDDVTGVFSHPSGGEVSIQWTIGMANKAGLTKNPTWKQYPRAMLRARCISEGIRTVYPGVSVGIYTPEEVADFAPAVEKDITPQAHAAVPTPMPERVKAAAAKVADKPRKPDLNVIEGTATPVTSISGDPSESDLTGVAGDVIKVPQATLDKIIAAFADIGINEELLVVECGGKPMAEWVEADLPAVRKTLAKNRRELAEAQANAAAAGQEGGEL
jgi:hypothetical protein